MLAQTFTNVKTQIQEPVIHQDVQEVISEFQPAENKVGSLRYTGDASNWKVANQVLAGTMDEATSVLGSVCAGILIPGTNFASCESIAEYFGVTTRYLRIMTARIGLIGRVFPGDVEYREGLSFLKKHGIKDNFAHNGVVYKSKDGSCVIREASDAYYSARAILVIACAMDHARRFGHTVMNNNVGSVFAMVSGSVYGDRARMEEGMVNATTPGEDSAILNKDGNLVLTLDFFTTIIKTTVREAVAEAVSKISNKDQAPSSSFKMDDKVPGLIAAQESGIISAEQAAKILGVHRTTYFNIKSRYKAGK